MTRFTHNRSRSFFVYPNKREKYMLGALRAIAAFGNGEPAMLVLLSYMEEHGLSASVEEDVRRWVDRIAEDAILCAEKAQRDQCDQPSQNGQMAALGRAA